MIDKVEYIEIDEVKYPFFCGLNVLEEIQNKYGSVNNWEKRIIGKHEESNGEISIPDLKIAVMFMLNEGAEIEGNELFTEKQVGRIISNYGLVNALELVQKQVSTCIFGKNVQTTKSQTITEKKAK